MSTALFHLVETPRHELVVVEERVGIDAVVFEHPRVHAGQLEYEVVVETEERVLRLRLTLPERVGPGQLQVSSRLQREPEDVPTLPAMVCKLEPISGTPGEG